MAKSTGNVVLVSDVVDRGYDALALRLAFLQTRYRQQANLSWDAISAADRLLARWRSLVAEWAETPSGAMPAEARAELTECFENDLDFPSGLQVLRRLIADPDVAPGSKLETLLWVDGHLGLDLARDIGKAPAALPAGTQSLLDERSAARAGKDFAGSDRLRDELAALGVVVQDTKDGQTWSLA